ncbi:MULTISPECIES: type II secretion system F family protein [unclassified Alcanivorax]|uniref:type II secretion system F family protein n=1 Tax=unclassified Alcanivorax TaxID=2638842 RepID=UPI00017EB99D|nr:MULTISPECIES: type II secretion system F family protein [unclassified Alcanivorax]EDX88044.1 Bacterial type II secretion system protein F domain [Alcanivorax sp. DG881]
MSDLFLALSVVLVLVALWLLLFKAREWEMRARVHARLHDTAGVRVENDSGGFWLWRISGALTESSLAASDYEDIRLALKGMGKTREQSQVIYLLSCWLLPVLVAAIGFLFFGALGGLLMSAAGFILPRRTIRGMGAQAEMRQNLEAVELCHMTRMLMEAGLSLERVLRIIGVQGRPLLPILIARIDRFNRLMKSGAERTQALDELGENKRIPVLRSYVVLMKQSSQLGAGVSHSLDQIIDEAQNVERNRIREETNRIGAKMTVIMMAFMLPALFILIGGPAVVSIAEALTR